MSPVRQRKLFRQKLRRMKDRPCHDCGGTFQAEQMTFDHVRGEKLFNLGGSLGRKSEKQIMEETAKCEVVCIDCHRIREWLRGTCGLPEELKVVPE